MKCFKQALKNLSLHSVQTFGCVLALMIFSLSLYFGVSIEGNIRNGIEQTSERIGAKQMLVPSSGKDSYETLLLQSEPSAFYLDRSITDRLDGLKITYSPQIYLKTLKASCCSEPLQVIGYDPESDFTLKPWLTEEMKGTGVTVGYSVGCEDTILLFGTEYPVSGRLSQTGSGFDHSVYVPFRYISHMFEDSLEMGAEYYIDDINTVYSVIMIKDNCELPEFDNISVVRNSGLISEMESSLSGLVLVIRVFLVLLGIATEGTVLIMTALSSEAKKREMGIYRILGIDRYTVLRVFSLEGMFSGLIGTVLGTAIGIGLMNLFGEFLSASFSLPYSPYSSVYAVMLSLAVPFIPYILTVLVSVGRLTKDNGYNSVQN